MIFYDRLETVVENARLHALLDGVAAAVVGLIAATAIQLGWGQFSDPAGRVILASLFAIALAVVWLWKGPFAAPALVFAAGLIGALSLA